MAYKFQLGSARLSGSTVFEQPLSTLESFSAQSLSSSAGLQVGGTVELDGVADASVAVGADKFYILDADDGLMKTEAVGDLMSAVAGAGLGESSDQLEVQVDDSTIEINSDSLRLKDDGVTGAKLAPAVAAGGLTQDGSGNLQVGAGSLIDVQADQVDVDLTEAAAATVADGDFLIFLDGGTTGAASKGSTQDLATLFAGDGLSTSSSRLAVAVSGAMSVEADKVGISGSIAGAGLSFSGGAASISKLDVGVDDSTIEINSDALRLKDDGVTGAKLAPAVAAGGLTQDGSGNLQVGAGSLIDVQADQVDVDLTEAAAATVADGDFLIFLDGGTSGAASKGSTADLAALLDGNGLSRSNSTLSVDLNELAAAAVNVANDSIAIIDADDSNGSKKESISDFMSAVAGTALQESSGQLRVKVTGSVARSLGAVGVSGSIAGSGLSFQGNEASVTALDLSIGEFSTVQVASGDKFLMLDSNGSTHQLETVDSLSEFQAGDGLAHSSGVLSVGVDDSTVEISSDALRIKDDGVTGAKLAPAVAGAGLAQDGSGNLDIGAATNGGIAVNANDIGLNLNDLSAADVDVVNDSIVIIDANDSNASRKESISDFVDELPAVGGGISASGGKLTVADTVTALGDANASLQFGINVQTSDMTAARKHTLPVPVAGRKLVVKGKNTGTHNMTIEVDDTAATKIDGAQTSIVIESDAGAVTLLCTSASRWIIV